MNYVIQRIADLKFFTGIYGAEWSHHVSAAVAYPSKEEAVKEMRDRGFRLTAMFFEALPTPKERTTYTGQVGT